jgi:hypothetical protein
MIFLIKWVNSLFILVKIRKTLSFSHPFKKKSTRPNKSLCNMIKLLLVALNHFVIKSRTFRHLLATPLMMLVPWPPPLDALPLSPRQEFDRQISHYAFVAVARSSEHVFSYYMVLQKADNQADT